MLWWVKAKSQAFRVCFPLCSLLILDTVRTYKPLPKKLNEKEEGYSALYSSTKVLESLKSWAALYITILWIIEINEEVAEYLKS